MLVFVDQAEELVSPTMGEEQAQLLALLKDATRGPGPLWALMTLRSEFLSAFLQTEHNRVAFDDQLLVGPLDNARLAEVIERPADRAGMSLAPGLIGRMVADTGGGDALPLLAHTLAALYGRAVLADRARITSEDYDELGGVLGAIRRSADDERRRLGERGLEDLVIPTLMRLVTLSTDGQPSRRRLARRALTLQEDEVVQAFIDARLLTSSDYDGQAAIDVAHEALLRQWPPLADAVERHREALQLRAEVERAASDWDRSARRDGYLLRSERLTPARALIEPGELARTDLDV